MTYGSAVARIAGLAVAVLTATPAALAQTASANQTQLKRGEYLVTFGGCHDCHSPKVMTPNGPAPDKSRLLSAKSFCFRFRDNTNVNVEDTGKPVSS